MYYYKYTVEGMNIILVNLLAFVLLSLLFGYIPALKATVGSMAVFLMSLLSIVPLAYYIGMAISSISAQSTFAVGAVLNATFGSIVELILYFTALTSSADLGGLVCQTALDSCKSFHPLILPVLLCAITSFVNGCRRSKLH